MRTEDWCPYCENVVEGDIIFGEYEMVFMCDNLHETPVPYEDDYDKIADDPYGALYSRDYYDTE